MDSEINLCGSKAYKIEFQSKTNKQTNKQTNKKQERNTAWTQWQSKKKEIIKRLKYHVQLHIFIMLVFPHRKKDY